MQLTRETHRSCISSNRQRTNSRRCLSHKTPRSGPLMPHVDIFTTKILIRIPLKIRVILVATAPITVMVATITTSTRVRPTSISPPEWIAPMIVPSVRLVQTKRALRPNLPIIVPLRKISRRGIHANHCRSIRSTLCSLLRRQGLNPLAIHRLLTGGQSMVGSWMMICIISIRLLRRWWNDRPLWISTQNYHHKKTQWNTIQLLAPKNATEKKRASNADGVELGFVWLESHFCGGDEITCPYE